MATGRYKWRLVISKNQGEMSCFLHPLPAVKDVDSRFIYVHKPGDINYADVRLLSTKSKQRILDYVEAGHVKEDNPENKVEVQIAGMILLDRLADPNFMPEELKS